MHPRNLIVADRQRAGDGDRELRRARRRVYFTNAVTESVASATARTLDHYKIQRESARAFHVGTIEATPGARQPLRVVLVRDRRGAVAHEHLHDARRRRAAAATLNGLYMLDGEQHCDHQTQHRARRSRTASAASCTRACSTAGRTACSTARCTSIPIAQKTDGKQTNNTLLLSEEAQVDTKPQLEIFADDVKCTHGATVGRIDEMALFYMKSRGIGPETARRLLTYAFAADVLETIELEPLKKQLEEMVLARFSGSTTV